MAVLVEGISVVVQRAAIDTVFPGGWEEFVGFVPNQTLCYDEHLARVGFMTPDDAGAFVAALEALGLCFLSQGEARDLAVVDQLTGPTTTAPWLHWSQAVLEPGEVNFVRKTGTADSGVAVPANWKYEESLSARPGFIPSEEMGRLKFLRHEGGKDVYLDTHTGRTTYVSRPQIDGDAEAAIVTRLRAAFHEVLEIERELNGSGKRSERELYSRLGELLTTTEELIAGPGQELARTYFVRGLILRVLERFHEAEGSFRTANELRPGEVNTLRELVLCLGEQGKHEAALPFARSAVAIAPDDTGALGNLASTLARAGKRTNEGLQAIQRALELDPTDEINRRVFELFYRR